MTHHLKIDTKYFNEVALELKKFELRKNDRDYKEYDRLILNEFNPKTQTFTGNSLIRVVGYVLKNCPGLNPDYVILQIYKPI